MAKIAEKIASLPPETQYFSLEFFPPKTAEGSQNLLPRLYRLRALQPLFVCVTFSAGGSTASKSLELADLCQNQLDLTTCLHLTCTNIQKSVIDNVLRECKKLGIRNILALRGDEPRPGEYAPVGSTNGAGANGAAAAQEQEEDNSVQFNYAVDLIRYIRAQYGDYFCIGAAAYPEGHPVSSASHAGGYFQTPEHDFPYLVEKVEAGADFLMTQLFYDVNKYLSFEKMVREHENAAFREIPIVPGLMPVQGWQSFSRTCKLAKIGLPADVKERLEVAKGDDEGVKEIGVEIVGEIIDQIKAEAKRPRAALNGTATTTGNQTQRKIPLGFHFYTLNLEKAVAQILERCDLISTTAPSTPVLELPARPAAIARIGSEEAVDSMPSVIPARERKARRRRSSAAHNRVVVSRPSTSSGNADFEALENEAAQPREKSQSKENALAIAEGEGSLGREATWDDFPNGRWGDARSPAYAAINNYALHPLLSPTSAVALWSHPTSVSDITSIFRQYLLGTLSAIPWSEDSDETGLRPETALIKDELLRINERNWWTVASQPAVNAVKSGDEVVGWGPRKGGLVWQKPFVEFFLPSKDWTELKKKLDATPKDLVYFAGNAKGDFEGSDKSSVNPVTWGAFKGKEIITPTIIEGVSFRAWQDEAFEIWQEWQAVFMPQSASAKLLRQLRDDVWLVNVIGHDYVGGKQLWEALLDD